MAKNLVRKRFDYQANWIAPAGVNKIMVRAIGKLHPQISLGNQVSNVIDIYGRGFAWGNGANAALGVLSSTASRSSPVAIENQYLYRQLSAGVGNQFGLNTFGDLYGWGLNTSGVLGNNSTSSRSSPVVVSGSLKWMQVSNSRVNNWATGLTAYGVAYAWGDNTSGNIGDNTTTNRSTPTAVAGSFGPFASISAGDNTAYAIRKDANRQGVAWGANASGQIGDNSVTLRSTPVAISGSRSWIDLQGGTGNALGLERTTQLAYAWGLNSNGVVGDGTTTNRSTPVAVSGGRTFTKIAAGSTHVMAVGTDGIIYSWGANNAGQLGVNDTNNRSSPVAVLNISNPVAIAVGVQYSMAMLQNGQLYAWGLNTNGAIGDQSTTSRSTPVAVTGFGYGSFSELYTAQMINEAVLAVKPFDVVPGNSYPIGLLEKAVCFGYNPIYSDGVGAFPAEIEIEYFA